MTKKKVSTNSRKTSKKSLDKWGDLFACIGVIACLYVGFQGIYFLFSGGPTVESGQCYLDRSYQPLRVDYVYTYIKDEVDLTQMGIQQSTSGWYLYSLRDYPTTKRPKSFVQKFYTKIPCESL